MLGIVAVIAAALTVQALSVADTEADREALVLDVLDAVRVPGRPFAPILLTNSLAVPGRSHQPSFEPVDAMLAGLDPVRMEGAVATVMAEVERGGLPGAALILGRGTRVVAKYGIGTTEPGGPTVVPDWTIYDLASLTKVLATTTAVMLLVEDGAMRLDAPVSTYLPEFTGPRKDGVTIRHLLTHTSGLPAGTVLPGVDRHEALQRIMATPLRWRPGQRVEYSDLGPIVLFAAAERAAGEQLSHFLQRRVFRPLGMRNTGFNPLTPCTRCAPTSPVIHGSVHDPLAQRLGGVAGNAGLFSTASDVARFAAMLAGGGELEGVRVLDSATIDEFTTRQPGAGTRALGWDTPDPMGNGAAGLRISPRAFGHTGFTGTSLWIDPDRGSWAVLLTNRTLFEASNRMQELRRAVNDHLADAADLAIAD